MHMEFLKTYANPELHPQFLSSKSQNPGRIAHVHRPPVVLRLVSAVNVGTLYVLAPSCSPFTGNLDESPTSSTGTSYGLAPSCTSFPKNLDELPAPPHATLRAATPNVSSPPLSPHCHQRWNHCMALPCLTPYFAQPPHPSRSPPPPSQPRTLELLMILLRLAPDSQGTWMSRPRTSLDPLTVLPRLALTSKEPGGAARLTPHSAQPRHPSRSPPLSSQPSTLVPLYGLAPSCSFASPLSRFPPAHLANGCATTGASVEGKERCGAFTASLLPVRTSSLRTGI